MSIVSINFHSESGDDYSYLFETVESPEHLVALLDAIIIEEWQYLYIRGVNSIPRGAVAAFQQAVQDRIEAAQQLEDGFYD